MSNTFFRVGRKAWQGLSPPHFCESQCRRLRASWISQRNGL